MIDVNQDYPGNSSYLLNNFGARFQAALLYIQHPHSRVAIKLAKLHNDCAHTIINNTGKGGSRIGYWNCTEGYKNCQIWAKELHDGSYAIALYNAVSKNLINSS